MLLLNGDCLELMKTLPDGFVDCFICDLPYGNGTGGTALKWDCMIDLDLFWKEILRLRKDERTPIFHFCNTRFGINLINSAPKKMPFRYDIVWIKSAPVGFLCAKKQPLKSHEMIYAFYEKAPFYDLSSHKHKWVDTINYKDKKNVYGCEVGVEGKKKRYTPGLPKSVQYENEVYASASIDNRPKNHGNNPLYDPPLPKSVQYEDDKSNKGGLYGNTKLKRGAHEGKTTDGTQQVYKPPLPKSVQYEDYGTGVYGDTNKIIKKDRSHSTTYDPPLPKSYQHWKSEKGRHQTQKPLTAIKWLLKYFTKEGDVVMDATMGSGTTGLGCLEMNREFIGIEQDTDIYEAAEALLISTEADLKV